MKSNFAMNFDEMLSKADLKPQAQPKGICKADERRKLHIRLAVLNPIYIGPLAADIVSQFFLSQSKFLATFSKDLAIVPRPSLRVKSLTLRRSVSPHFFREHGFSRYKSLFLRNINISESRPFLRIQPIIRIFHNILLKIFIAPVNARP